MNKIYSRKTARKEEPEILAVLSIKEIEDRTDLELVQDPETFRKHAVKYGYLPPCDFNGFFVKSADGEFIEVWGFYGVPYYNKNAYKIYSNE